MSKFCKKLMRNVALPILLGQAIMQVKWFCNRSHWYMTDICYFPSLYLYLSAARQTSRMEPNYYHVNEFPSKMKICNFLGLHKSRWVFVIRWWYHLTGWLVFLTVWKCCISIRNRDRVFVCGWVLPCSISWRFSGWWSNTLITMCFIWMCCRPWVVYVRGHLGCLFH